MTAAMITTTFAEASAAAQAMREYIAPAIVTISGFAALVSTAFLITGGLRYISSTGQPEKLDQAKRILRNALVGLVIVLAAASITALLAHAYTGQETTYIKSMPTLNALEQQKQDIGLFDVVIKTIIKFLQSIVEGAAKPFLTAISSFINATPLMGNNSSVFNLWLAVVGIADVLFVGVVALLGFQVMSYASLGLDEVDVKQLLPQFALIFLLMNTSIFAIDGVVSLSNAMIHALQVGFKSTDIWLQLSQLTEKSNELGLVGLLIMVAMLVLTIMLLVYYVLRMVALYIGAILSPLVAMLWLIPAFKDFAIAALKTYLTLIFVLFVHAVIVLLAASLFDGAIQAGLRGQPNVLMALIVGIATVISLLKTQGVMQNLSYAASAPRAARELSSTFVRSASSMRRNTSSIARAARVDNKKTQSSRPHTTLVITSLSSVQVSGAKPGKTSAFTNNPKAGGKGARYAEVVNMSDASKREGTI